MTTATKRKARRQKAPRKSRADKRQAKPSRLADLPPDVRADVLRHASDEAHYDDED